MKRGEVWMVQVRGKARLLSQLGELPPERLSEVEERLLDVLGMEYPLAAP
jgi:mRNA-degrading endonuclease toxin of MazEF toxin-antitoxin module